MLNNKSILITGGTGSFGKQITKKILEKFNPKKLLFSQEMSSNNQKCKMKKFTKEKM